MCVTSNNVKYSIEKQEQYQHANMNKRTNTYLANVGLPHIPLVQHEYVLDFPK